MRFMIIRKGDAETEAGVMPTRQLAEDMMRYHEEMGRDLKILGGDGLQPTAKGAKVKFRKGKPLVTDGPFTETKEVIGGYAIIQAKDEAEVLEWTKRFLRVHEEHWTVTSEIREIAEG
jgi:hypothetical protein